MKLKLVAGLALIGASAFAGTAFAQDSRVAEISEEEGVSSESSMEAMRQMIPVDPAEIRAMRRLREEAKEATNQPLNAPTPTSRSIKLEREPGSLAPVLQVRPNFDTTVTFQGISGGQWKVEKAGVGNPNAYAVSISAGSAVTVKPTSSYRMSNLSVMLEGQSRPVQFTLLHDPDTVDYEVNAIMPQIAPGSEMHQQIMARYKGGAVPGLADKELTQFLDGVTVDGAQRVMSMGDSNAQVWWHKNHLVVRSRKVLLDPQPDRKLAGQSGYYVYTAKAVRPVLLLMNPENGDVTHLQLSLTQKLREIATGARKPEADNG